MKSQEFLIINMNSYEFQGILPWQKSGCLPRVTMELLGIITTRSYHELLKIYYGFIMDLLGNLNTTR